jgi:CubicO group peptidase (beta-lactamase class C family)
VFAQTPSENVGRILNSYYGDNTPSIGVLVLKDNNVVAKNIYGYANMEKKEKAGVKTNYNLGTLSEQFVVTTALILKEKGELDIQSSLTEHFQELPEYCKQVKINHLLNHNSGLPILPRKTFTNDIKNKEDIFKFLNKKDKLDYKPGRRSSWNSINYGLLAAIVNSKLETSFRKYIKRNIFEPLGMNNSEIYRDGWFSGISNKAPGYLRLEDGKFENIELKNDDYIPGTRGIYSNLDDMKKWLNVWKTDTLLSNTTLGKVKRINYVRGQSEFPGYGWKRGFNKGKKYLYAGGISEGNTHLLLIFPSAGIDIVILSNQSSLFNLRKNAFRLLNLFADKKYEVK